MVLPESEEDVIFMIEVPSSVQKYFLPNFLILYTLYQSFYRFRIKNWVFITLKFVSTHTK